MPEYLAPAVYVEETSFRSKSIEGVGTSTAAFVGATARGPVSAGTTGVTPPLLTSFTDFELYYGGVDDLAIGGNAAINFLAHAASAFFANGGGRLYVARILGAGAQAAASGPVNAAAPPAPPPAAADAISINARFAGGSVLPGQPGINFSVRLIRESLASSKRLALRMPAGTMVGQGTDFFIMGGIGNAPLATTAANLTAWNALADDAPVTVLSLGVEVTASSGVAAEYSGLGFHSRHPRYAGLVLGAAPPNAADALTNPIVLVIGANITAFTLRAGLLGTAAERTVTLSGGSDGTGAPADADYSSALNRLLALEDVAIVAAPGAASFAAPTPASVNQMLIGHAETRRAYRIAVLDSPPSLEPQGVRDLKSLVDSKYAALYYPWIRVSNPLAATDPTQSREIHLPPSGFVCGIYARNDIQRSVSKAPANEVVTGALGLQRDVRFGEQEVLNPLGINCIRALPNRGIRVWGARTLSSDPEWKYVNVRRYFLYLEASIDRGTQWAVFENNGERLWANVRTTVSDFLYNEWISGSLLGTTPKEAFFVRCDRSTMTQNDLDNGRMICLIGVAALKPAEFVIFRIGQKTADSRD
ncbi:MAG: phage tail sheath family protein [Acetobacteraceae bacterium]|nr:phage tail sheath family protein [Acetobacteraceae bacterium]